MGQIDIAKMQIGNLDEVIHQVCEAMQADDFPIEPPAKPEMFTMVERTKLTSATSRKVSDFLGQRKDYVHFLKNLNGLEYNGLIIYGLGDSIYPESSPMNILKINQDIFSDPDLIDHNLQDCVLVGEDSTSVLTYNSRHDVYEIRDRIGTDYIEKEFAQFDQLLEEEFNKVQLDPVNEMAHD